MKKPALLCCLIFSVRLAAAGDEPEKLQKQGMERIEQYREHFYRTGERDSLRPQLEQGERELKSSYDTFIAKGDFAGAAFSEIQLGRLENIRSVDTLSIATGSHGINVASAQPIESHNDAAFRMFSTARELAKKARDPGREAEALIGLARTDGLNRGNVSDGVDDVTEAIRLAAQAGKTEDLFDALDLAAELELKRGRLAAATEYLDRAMALSTQVQKKLLVYFSYRDRADIYRNRVEVCTTEPRYGECYEALKLARVELEHARGICQDLGYQFLLQDTRREFGDLDVLQQLVQSQERFLKANSQYFSPKAPKDVLVTEHFAAGGSPERGAQLKKFLQQYPGFTGSPDPRSYFVQGEMREMEGNNQAALVAYLKTLELLERDRRRLRDDQSRGTFLEDKIDFYYAPITILLDQHRLAEAFDLMEKSRSRGMADLLRSRPLDFGTSRERELFSETEQLKARIGAEQQRLFRFTVGGTREKHAEEISESEAKISKLEGELQLVTSRIAKDAPRLGTLTESDVVSLQRAQQMARQEDYDLLYYLALPTELIVWHIGGEDVEVRNVFLPRNYLIDKVVKLRSSLTGRAQDKDARFEEQTSRELFLFLIQPMLKSIKTRHLVIVPHEDLNYVPFQALQDPADGMYVGEKFQVTYAPSATVLDSLKDKPNIAGGKLLAVAPTIEDARAEVQAIGSLYPGRSKIVVDVPVKKDDLKKWASDYNLLHLSVHGRFEESDPLLSYLELNPAAQEAGHLTAAEMFALPLPKGSMVVLSACETGRVRATHANELLGMQRALLYAGASELVLSSWEVEAKSTALWMETFYREAQRQSPSEAARLALVAVKSRPEYGHPYFWGAFLMTGK